MREREREREREMRNGKLMSVCCMTAVQSLSGSDEKDVIKSQQGK